MGKKPFNSFQDASEGRTFAEKQEIQQLSIPSRMLLGHLRTGRGGEPLCLSIPSRMLPQHPGVLCLPALTTFQFLLGCFETLSTTGLLRRFYLSIPSRMLPRQRNSNNCTVDTLSIPSRMLHKYNCFQLLVILVHFQFLLGCFLRFSRC